ncbi:phosphatidylserine decarboxylase [Isachenkonia alkalipeptolytica]|uniref:Phosphatidylserine decarboxylase proenzyme n=1 Tax=Isachenkonia alkalipeptolytica TaxID=2565777 RepID=A0AA43XJ33_9CLOT|nr:phosphatidylserine decarboxylase [Isachenkonia alkalipeptolytica]NBG87376.1 phosphatidylserine decarboxylase [Isachenkonia alkalipeptolytica]
MKIEYIERKTGEVKEEKVPGKVFLQWIYGNRLGKLTLGTLVKRKWFSKLYGISQDWSFSKRKIKSFVENQGINLKEAEREKPGDYHSFNDFFTRKLKKEARPVEQDAKTLVSPADGKLFAYENIDREQVVQIKGLSYSLAELIGDKTLAEVYQGGSKIIIRLAPSDYHRFHFPDSGVMGHTKEIKGQYSSVNPMALEKIIRLYVQNKRAVTKFRSQNFGEMLYIEIGATCVGTIVQTATENQPVKKGEEKGYFAFGGSTVILFFKPGEVKIHKDLLEHTQQGMETKVYMGQGIGEKPE